MKANQYVQPQNITCGKVSQTFEKLQQVVKNKAEELSASIDLAEGEKKEFAFWTADFPELIGVGKFSKVDGIITYELDYSETTL